MILFQELEEQQKFIYILRLIYLWFKEQEIIPERELCKSGKELNLLDFKPFTKNNLIYLCIIQMSHVMRKPTFCICKNKDADQLRGSREADQRLCFCYLDSTIPLLSKSEISSLKPSSVAVQPGLCRTRSGTRTFVFS